MYGMPRKTEGLKIATIASPDWRPPWTSAWFSGGGRPSDIPHKDLPRTLGTAGGFSLRMGQFLFAAASVVIMVTGDEFDNFTAFCYLAAAMALQFLCSFVLATLDVYALLIKRGLRNSILLSLFVVGG